MNNKRSFKKGIAITVILSFLVLGTCSIANAIPTNDASEVIDFSTYLGGTGDEHTDIAYSFGETVVDSKGNIIVGGRTSSTDFPVKDAFQEHFNGTSDGTISKFAPNGTLIFSTYFGGVGQEQITDVAIDSEDNIVVFGTTGSPNLPMVNAFKSNATGIVEGSVDCFIAKFSEDGQPLLYSSYFGGDGNDYGYTMNIYSNDRIAISGTTDSTDLPLENPHQDTFSGALDVFVALLEADGQSLLFSTYIGTPGIDHGRRVAFDSQGNVLVTGICAIGNIATTGSYQDEHAGGTADAFLAKFDYTGELEFLTFLGGEATDWGNDLAIDTDDNIVITGFTTSDEFPLSNAIQEERLGYADMFISKVASDGQSLVFSTYLGGTEPDYGNDVAIDAQNRILILGQTESLDFPTNYTFGAPDSTKDNTSLVVFNPDGSLLLSLNFGGAEDDVGIGITCYSEDSYVLLGYTESDDFPTHEAYQETYAGQGDMFVMKMDLEDLLSAPSGGNGFTLGIVEISIIIGVVVVVIFLLFLKRRTG